MADLEPFLLRAFDDEVQARADLERLRGEIRAAEADRDRIRDEARREGLERGLSEARDRAEKSERERVAGETAELGRLLGKAAQALAEHRAAFLAGLERDVVGLAVAIAGRIVKAEVELGRPVALHNLRRAVELTARRQELRILLHPQDMALVESYLPELRRGFPEIDQIALEASPALERGGVTVRTRTGVADASLAAQLEEIERGLVG